MENDIRIEKQGDHYAVYVGGVFFCTAETYTEAVEELKREGFVM
jgi:hypothetical protein